MPFSTSSSRQKNLRVQSPFFTEPFLLICAYLNCAGWALSAMHQLNAAGYMAALGVGAGVAWIVRPDMGRIRLRRFSKGFPLGFAVLFALVLLGSLLYVPNNYDGLAYRVPRIFHWLDQSRWHWIPTEFTRLNTRPVGWEWVAAPILALSRSYRWLWLPNLLSFALLPGLVFSTFTRLGVKPRVAWYWMWIAPTGYCFLIQAGGIGNDMIVAAPTLAAIDFALRARASKRLSEGWYSILSAALMTGFKTTNLPLLLGWAIAFAPSLPLFKKRIPVTLAVLAVSVATSFLPLAALNQKFGGDWTGLKADNRDPYAYRIPVNIVGLFAQNFAPPVFPLASRFNTALEQALPQRLLEDLNRCFEKGIKKIPETTIEESAGLGFGVSFLLVISLLGGFFVKQNAAARRSLFWFLLLAPWVSLLVVLHKSGAATVARFITAYYLLLIPVLIVGNQQTILVRTRWWRIVAWGCCGIALLPLIVLPSRPLWPAQSLLAQWGAPNSSEPLLRRAWEVYSFYGERPQAFAHVRPLLPNGVHKLGFLSFDAPEASLWMPTGSLQIRHITRKDQPANLKREGIDYILANPQKAEICLGRSFEDWVTAQHLQIIGTVHLHLLVANGEENWYLVKLPTAN